MSDNNEEENKPFMLNHPFSINDNDGEGLKIGGIPNGENEKGESPDGDTPIINVE